MTIIPGKNLTPNLMIMTRTSFRKAQRARVRAGQRIIARALNLPKGLFQFAARHDVMPEQIRNERLKYPF